MQQLPTSGAALVDLCAWFSDIRRAQDQANGMIRKQAQVRCVRVCFGSSWCRVSAGSVVDGVGTVPV